MAQPLTVENESENDFNDELKPGHTLMQGQFVIDSFLNSGGFGITYLARNSLDRRIVIKECFPGAYCRRSTTSVIARSRTFAKEFESIVRNFVDEAHSLAKLKHPNVVGVHQVFEENKTAYMVIDYIEGRDLLELIQDRSGMPKPAQIEIIFRKLLDAVDHIHKQDILHRDISPDNILLNPDMEPVLIDFGAARQDAGKENRILSELHVVKDGYSPHEFYVAGTEQGPYSDLYALAATFYHIITDELPVNSQTRISAVAAGEADPYVPLAGQVDAFSDAFLRGIDKALATMPKDRFATAASWMEFLENPQPTATTSNPTTDALVVRTTPSEPTSKGKVRMLAMIGLAVPIMGGTYVMLNSEGSVPVSESVVAIGVESAEEPVAVALAETAPEATPVTSEETAAAPDLSALLNLAAAATAQAEAAAREAEMIVADEAAQAAALPDAIDSANPVDTAEANVFTTDAADPLPQAAFAQDARPAPTSEPVTEAQIATAPVVTETFDLPQVDSAWTVDLAGVQADAAYTVENVTLASVEEVETSLHQMVQAPTGSRLKLSVMASADKDADVLETIEVPVIHRTSFPDTTTFETRMIDNVWMTTVVAAPADSELEVNDVLLGDLDAELLFDKRTSLPDTLVQAQADNTERLTLAIRRGDDLTAISILLPR